MRVCFIATVLNESKSIRLLLDSLLRQTHLPSEVVICDGGSTDDTSEILQSYKRKFEKKRVVYLTIQKKGNRSVGRNAAIQACQAEYIVCSDAGCILDKNWIKEIIKPFMKRHIDIVSGYYKGRAATPFQKCLVPYVLVMEDKVSPENFLPSSRSMAFRKTIWEKIGGFPEQFFHNEDYVFANMLKRQKASFSFAKEAIAYWIPRDNISKAFIMFFRFAYGDVEAGIFRPKVVLLFVRYTLFVVLLSLTFTTKNYIIEIVFITGAFYLVWAIMKNIRYCRNFSALFFLPLLQITADVAVLSGSTYGFIKKYI